MNIGFVNSMETRRKRAEGKHKEKQTGQGESLELLGRTGEAEVWGADCQDSKNTLIQSRSHSCRLTRSVPICCFFAIQTPQW